MRSLKNIRAERVGALDTVAEKPAQYQVHVSGLLVRQRNEHHLLMLKALAIELSVACSKEQAPLTYSGQLLFQTSTGKKKKEGWGLELEMRITLLVVPLY